MGIPPLWAAAYPLALVDLYGDRLVCRGRAQLKQVVPFAVVPLSTIKRVTRASWFPKGSTPSRRLGDPRRSRDGAADLLFRGDSAEFTVEWLSDPSRRVRNVTWIVVESRSHRINAEFLGNRGVKVEDGTAVTPAGPLPK